MPLFQPAEGEFPLKAKKERKTTKIRQRPTNSHKASQNLRSLRRPKPKVNTPSSSILSRARLSGSGVCICEINFVLHVPTVSHFTFMFRTQLGRLQNPPTHGNDPCPKTRDATSLHEALPRNAQHFPCNVLVPGEPIARKLSALRCGIGRLLAVELEPIVA